MANTKKQNTIFAGTLAGTLNFAETFKYGKDKEKTGIKGAFVTSRKDQNGDWTNGSVNISIFQPTLRIADGEGFKDVEVEERTAYRVTIAAAEIALNPYTNKDGVKVETMAITTGLKPTVSKIEPIGQKGDSAPSAPSAPADNSNYDDIPF